jgi:tetratricopeptide (TPR) repeat protein
MSRPDSRASHHSPPRVSPLAQLLFWTVAVSGALTYLFAREAMNPSVAVATGAHVILGALLLFALPRLASALIKAGWRARLAASLPSSLTTYGAPLLLLVTGLSGAMLLGAAAAGHSVGHWRGTYIAHVAAGLAVLILVAANLAWRLARFVPRTSRAGSTAVASVLAIMVSAGALASAQYAAESYFADLTAATPAQAHNPLFPAGTRIDPGGDWEHVPHPASCGDAGCHPEVVKQWAESTHAHANNNPEYRVAFSKASATLGHEGERWCTGCHAPLSLTPVTATHGAPAAEIARDSDSVSCLGCHAMSRVESAVGNGVAQYTAPPVYPLSGARAPAGKWIHGFMLRVRPAPHRAGLHGPSANGARSAMCLPCHRLSVNAPQNGYKFLRFDETWSDWQASGYSGESAHVFEDAPQRADCVDCHFQAGGKGSSHLDHSCGLANHGIHEPGGSGLTPASSGLHVEVFALLRGPSEAAPTRFDAPLSQSAASVKPGQTVVVDVVVENRGIGHSFPSGLPTARDTRLEFTVTDRAGRALLAEPGPPKRFASSQGKPPASGVHTYGMVALNREGGMVGVDDFYTMVAPISVRALPAGEGEVVRYRFTVLHGARDAIRLTARLLRDRSGRDKEVLGEHTVTLPIAASVHAQVSTGAAEPNTLAARFFAYGVALMRPDAGPAELSLARSAIRRAIELQPRNPDYLTAMGRAYLAEGDLLSARAQLEQALKLDGRSPRARAWLGAVLLRMGQLEAALAILNPLTREFPRDRLLWIDVGLSYLKGAQYQPAADAFGRALAIDPDDAGAHYNLMRCYTALNRLTEARREEAIFHALQDDEPLTSLVEPFLSRNPALRRESLGVHTHVLEPIK